MEKTYATVLKDYSPVESGDFMLHYEINGREYVIYSPSEGVCSCLELYSFTDIDPEKLSFLIDSRNDIDVTEFRFVNRSISSTSRISTKGKVSVMFQKVRDFSYIL